MRDTFFCFALQCGAYLFRYENDHKKSVLVAASGGLIALTSFVSQAEVTILKPCVLNFFTIQYAGAFT